MTIKTLEMIHMLLKSEVEDQKARVNAAADLKNKRYDELCDTAEDCCVLNPDDHDYQYYLSALQDAHCKLQDAEEALEDFENHDWR